MVTREQTPTPEEKRRLLEEILHSATFARSDQLKRFLRYICEMELAGRADEISEYSIGTEALGRPSGYSPGDDSTVRSRAHSLRQKLEEFYEGEGAAATLRIELRKGSYLPHYVYSEPAKPEPAQPAVEPVARAGTSPWKAFAAGCAVALAAAAGLWVALPRGTPAAGIAPEVRAFWGPMLQPDGDVLLCIASAPSMLLKSYREGILPDEPRIFPAPPEVAEWYAGLQMMDGGGRLYSQTSTNTNLLGDSLAAITAAKVLTAAGTPFQVLPEYSVRPLALRGRNLLLIGSPNYSPHAARVLRESPFSLYYDAARKEEVIRERDSGNRTPVSFIPKRDELGRLTEAYGLLTVLPSPARGEGVQRTVIFSGITSAGTQAAMEFFSSPSGLRELDSQFRAAGLASIPEAYQVVVRCRLDKLLALSHSYETHRVMMKAPLVD